MRNIIATWIYLDSKEEQSNYYQTGKKSDTFSFQKIYWRCVILFYETSLRYNTSFEHILFSNTNQFPVVDGLDVRQWFEQNNIQIVVLHNQYVMPKGYYHSWQNQFYEFSIIEYMAKELDASDMFMLLDSDCVFSKSVAPMFERKFPMAQTFVNMFPEYDEKISINGLSRKEMQSIIEELLHTRLSETPRYCGGEILFATGQFLQKVAGDFPMLYQWLLDRNKNGLPKFNEEAHTLTYFYYKYDCEIAALNDCIKQMWTNPHLFRNIDPADNKIPILHLPAEKKRGFKMLYAFFLKNGGLRNIPENDYQTILYRYLLDVKKYNRWTTKFIIKLKIRINHLITKFKK